MKASRSDLEWQVYGELDYGASHDKGAGFAEWSLLKTHLQQYGLDGCLRICVELGCGAGRLTSALAQDFEKVYALDVSAHRIAQARDVVNCDRVSFLQLREPAIPLPSGLCDLCVSTHVLQHISDVRVVEAYLCEMLRILRPCGCLLVHVPVVGAHGITGELGEVIYRRGKEIAKGAVLAVIRQLMRAGFRGLSWGVAEYRVFSFVRLDEQLRQLGFENAELRILPWAGGHAYVFARKPASS